MTPAPKNIVADLGCADRGMWFSLEALADKYRPDRIYGFDPSQTLNLKRKRVNGIRVTLERKAAWLHDGTITYIEGAEYDLIRRLLTDGTAKLMTELLIEWHDTEDVGLVKALVAEGVTVTEWWL